MCEEKKNERVKIAILLATHNGEEYIQEQLDSLAVQNCQDFVCFIHDDASIDRTTDIVRKYCDLYPEMFTFMGSSRCGGARQNFMYMLRNIKADYFMFCDQDDFWLPEKVSQSFAEMKRLEKQEKDPNISSPLCVYGDVKVVDAELKVMQDFYFGDRGTENSTRELLKQNVVRGCTMMFNAALQTEMLNADNLNNIYMHDWWGALICSLVGELSYLEKPLMLYRQHEHNVIGAKKQKRLGQRIRELLSLRSWCQEKKKWIDKPRMVAKELIKVIPEENSQYIFLKELACIIEKNKIARMRFYIKNELLIKSSNTLIQLLFV